MRFSTLFCLAAAVMLAGCGKPDTAAPMSESITPAVEVASAETAAVTADSSEAATAAEGNTVALNPENTSIQFVGTHADPEKPDPRTGRFEQFSGTAVVDGAALKSVSVDIDTTSLATEIEKLTAHLKSPDFFNVNEHPNASFVSTSVEPGEGESVTITGELTLLGTTKSISFPATVSTDGGLQLNATFEIDRTEFGMDYGADKVLKEVQMTVTVGG